MKIKNPEDIFSDRAGIGTLKEKSLHVELIEWFVKPGDKLESNILGYIIDIVQDDILTEIQINNFSAIKNKLSILCEDHPIRLIHPIARQKWIIKVAHNGERISKRKSPKKGKIEEIFYELTHITNILSNPNLTVWVVMADIEEIWLNDGKGSWRRKNWSIIDRHLLEVVEIREFNQPKDYILLLPNSLPQIFTNNDVSNCLGISKPLARKITYCLRKMNEVKIVKKQGREYLFSMVNNS